MELLEKLEYRQSSRKGSKETGGSQEETRSAILSPPFEVIRSRHLRYQNQRQFRNGRSEMRRIRSRERQISQEVRSHPRDRRLNDRDGRATYRLCSILLKFRELRQILPTANPKPFVLPSMTAVVKNWKWSPWRPTSVLPVLARPPVYLPSLIR